MRRGGRGVAAAAEGVCARRARALKARGDSTRRGVMTSLTDTLSQLRANPGASSWEQLTAAADASTPDDEVAAVAAYILARLEVADRRWDFSALAGGGNDRAVPDFVLALTALAAWAPHLSASRQHDAIVACLFHVKPGLPWTTARGSRLARDIVDRLSSQFDYPRYIETYLRPNLLNLGARDTASLANPRLSLVSGYKRALTETLSGLRPALGMSSTGDADELRRAWRDSDKVKALSMAWFVVEGGAGDESPAVSSFLLNVLEDPDPMIKAQGLDVLAHYIAHSLGNSFIVRLGLVDLFLATVKVCLSYLPSLTPLAQSLYLLGRAYPVAFELLALQPAGGSLELVKLVSGNLLTALLHMRGRADTAALVVLLLRQLRHAVDRLGQHVLVSLSRILYTIHQVMSHPTALEEGDSGLEVVCLCLDIQLDILTMFGTKAPASLVFEYKYDFLAALAVVHLRVSKYILATSLKQEILDHVATNVAALVGLARATDKTLDNDILEATSCNPELRAILRPSGPTIHK